MDKVVGNRTIRLYSQIGKHALLHCTGIGKMIMTDMEDDEITRRKLLYCGSSIWLY
ncbi:IclR family transcriptional regulator domain-containing protein [Sporosarcina obsidiansis]